MQYIPPNMKTDMRLHHSIQHDEMECRHLGLSTFWCVYVSACRRCGLSTFWSVDVLVCRRFGLSTFWFVDVLVCRRFGLSTFRSVDVSVCRHFGLSTFWLSTFRFVDVLTSYPRNDACFGCLSPVFPLNIFWYMVVLAKKSFCDRHQRVYFYHALSN